MNKDNKNSFLYMEILIYLFLFNHKSYIIILSITTQDKSYEKSYKSSLIL